MVLKISVSRIGAGEYNGRNLDLDLVFDVDAELPVDPERDWEAFKTVIGRAGDGVMAGGDLIYAARDIIAGDVANSAVFALEQRFEGKETSDTKTAINRKNGKIVGFQRREVPQTAAGNKSAPGSYQIH